MRDRRWDRCAREQAPPGPALGPEMAGQWRQRRERALQEDTAMRLSRRQLLVSALADVTAGTTTTSDVAYMASVRSLIANLLMLNSC